MPVKQKGEVVAGGGEDKRLSRVVARDGEVVQVPVEYAVHPRRGLRDGFVQSFAQFHLDRLERRWSGGASLPACRETETLPCSSFLRAQKHPLLTLARTASSQGK